ncbi:MAG: hypothetical protein HUJ74_01680 [Lachnospiraceae bacterium]|nr:hypothetical protein [Lachnospiraceae bacterium]
MIKLFKGGENMWLFRKKELDDIVKMVNQAKRRLMQFYKSVIALLSALYQASIQDLKN